MEYLPRPGIVCVRLCGMRVLVPSRAASDACTTALPLNVSGYMIWNAIEQDQPLEKLLELYGVFSRLDPEAQRTRIEDFCQRLLALGFVTPKPAAAQPQFGET